MVWYDAVVLALLVYTAWSGAQKGLINQMAWIAALILCFKFADKLAPVIEPQINVELPLRHWIAMFILYVGFSLGSFMIARVMNSWMEKAKFKDFDRHLGGLLGFVKGGVIVLVATFFAVTISGSLKATVLQSHTGEAVCWFLDNVEPLTPEYFHEYLAQYQKELEPIHQDHLGHETSLPDLLGGFGSDSGVIGSGQGQGDGSGIPDFFDGLGNNTGANGSGHPDSTAGANAPTFDQMWRKLPDEIRKSVGSELQQRWNSATPEQKRNLVNNLTQSFDFQVPSVVNDFLIGSGQQSSRQGTGPAAADFQGRLAEIGDIYKDRDTIVRRTMEHLAGLPVQVQEAVINDWYADLTMQPSDPDQTTSIETRLDDRILNQVDRAGVWQRLSLDLQRRLNQSRR